mmetsp:Transcript_110669/g.307698  ORF Transcript_110669/g.307698 Transcript_110669/m.307698 type:complete len:89 (-) Transcript_110669:22-288(-)
MAAVVRVAHPYHSYYCCYHYHPKPLRKSTLGSFAMPQDHRMDRSVFAREAITESSATSNFLLAALVVVIRNQQHDAIQYLPTLLDVGN